MIGGWTTASLRQTRVLDPAPKSGYQTTDRNGGAWTQVSRLGMPLVNELVIGMKDKDLFNSSKPSGDAASSLTYVTNPSYPKLLETYLGAPGISPTNIPRNDLVTTFLTGIKGVNQLATVTPSEMLRLNTSIAAVPFAQQNRLGIVGNILAGGNGQRRLPERPPPEGRRRRHHADRGDGRPVHGQRHHRRARLRRRLQPVGRAAGRDGVQPERHRRPGRATVPGRLPVPEHADPGHRRARRGDAGADRRSPPARGNGSK